MLEYLMVLGHQQVQCSLQNHTYFLCYVVPLVTTKQLLLWRCVHNASSTKTKYKINHKWMELNSVEAETRWPPFCPTRTNKSKSLITMDNKKSPGAARFPVNCFYSYLAWYATIKTTEGNKNLMWGLPRLSGAVGLPVAPHAAWRLATPRVRGGESNHGSWRKNVVNFHSTMII